MGAWRGAVLLFVLGCHVPERTDGRGGSTSASATGSSTSATESSSSSSTATSVSTSATTDATTVSGSSSTGCLGFDGAPCDGPGVMIAIECSGPKPPGCTGPYTANGQTYFCCSTGG